MSERPETDPWFLLSERIDSFRIIPRLLLVTYYIFFIKAWFYIVDWFGAIDWEKVPSDMVVLVIAGFPAAILAILTGVLASLTNSYFRIYQKDR